MSTETARDAVGLLGLALVTGGTAMMHVPSAVIVLGLGLVVGAAMSARRG